MNNFTIQDNIVVCQSASGETYRLTENSCECKGFGFRHTCSHLKEAKDKGLFNKIFADTKRFLFLKSPYIVEQRKKAIVAFLIRQGIKSSVPLDRLENLVTSNMTPKQFIKIAKG